MKYHIDYDDKQYKITLDRLGRKMPDIEDRIVDALAEEAINAIQETILATFRQRSGALRGGIHKSKPQKGVRTIEPSVVYAAIHEYGGDIYPVNKKFLAFKIDGKWIFTKHVYIPPRPYFHPSIDRFLKSESARRVMVSALQREIDKVVA